jgi:hypothetical protein
MARQLYGTIVWEENPLYSGRTPIIERHAEEVEEYTNKVHDELENHKAENSYAAHKAVTLTESGFITPEIVQEINNLQTTLNDLTSRVNLRIPDGIIVPWNGTPSAPPTGWYWCNGTGITPDTRNRFILGGSSSTTYPLHSEVDANDWTSIFGTLSSLAAHTHTFYNAFFAEHKKYYEPSSLVNRTPFGWNTLGSNDSDTDNSLMYYAGDTFNYTGSDVSRSSVLSSGLPPYIKFPFIMKNAVDTSTTCRVQILSELENIQIYINDTTTTDRTVPWGTVISVRIVAPTDYEITSFTVNGVNQTLPFNYCVMEDITIVATERQKICNLKINQPAYGSTTANGVKITSQNYPFGTAMNITTTPNSTYKFTSYTVQFNGYTPKTLSLDEVNTYGIMTAALRAYSEDPEFIQDLRDYEAAKVPLGLVPAEDENLNKPVAESRFEPVTVASRIGQKKSTITTAYVNIRTENDYRVFVRNVLYSDFYGSRDKNAQVTVTLILDNEELGSKTYGYFNGGEMAVELVDKNLHLTAGSHRFDFKIETAATLANLDVALTDSIITLKPIGSQQEGV